MTKVKKSLKVNTILYAFKTLMGVIFPMITFPYASRILGAEGIGKVTFSNSIVSYFTLVASLGILSYAIREGAKYRDDRREFEDFASEIYTINLIATFISALTFCFSVFFFEKLRNYQGILLILGLAIPLTTVGVEWVFNIYEDYLYITVRSLIVQFLSLGILFFFVRTRQDVYQYAIFYLFSTVASNIFNLFYARKYCSLRLCLHKGMVRHLKPVMVIFASSVASTIYVSTDTTLLGMMHDDATVGYYAAASKIYSVLRVSVDAIVSVSFARLSFYLGNKMQQEFDRLARKIVNLAFLVLGPLTIGVFCMSKEAIHILNGTGFEPAIAALRILCIAMPFSVLASMLTKIAFLPYKHEKDILISTIIGATTNFGLNLYMIPMWREKGAAFTTVVAEILVLGIMIYRMRKFYVIRGWCKCLLQVLTASIPIGVVCYVSKIYLSSEMICAIAAVGVSGAIYVLILLILRNEIVIEYWGKIIKKGKNKRV